MKKEINITENVEQKINQANNLGKESRSSGYDPRKDPVRWPVSGRWRWTPPTEGDLEQIRKWRSGEE